MHAMGDVIDMRRFSGLRRALPITHWTFLCGAAALAGLPLLSGFWSKDDIFASLYTAVARAGPRVRIYLAILAIAMLTAFLTAFYTFRAYFMTFWGEERFPDEAGHHPHEAPPVMAWPLRILAMFALFIGSRSGRRRVRRVFSSHERAWRKSRSTGCSWADDGEHRWSVVAGVGLAWLLYMRQPELPGQVADGVSGRCTAVAQQVLLRRDLHGDFGGAAAWTCRGFRIGSIAHHRSDCRWCCA